MPCIRRPATWDPLRVKLVTSVPRLTPALPAGMGPVPVGIKHNLTIDTVSVTTRPLLRRPRRRNPGHLVPGGRDFDHARSEVPTNMPKSTWAPFADSAALYARCPEGEPASWFGRDDVRHGISIVAVRPTEDADKSIVLEPVIDESVPGIDEG